MKFTLVSFPAFAILATSLALAPARVSAQSSEITPSTAGASTTKPLTTTYPAVHTFSGDFKSTDGDHGTFVNTVTANSATSKSDVVVYTRSSDSKTRTETDDTTINSDGSRTIAHSSTDYGATSAFTSTRTLTKEKHGQFVGKGTYTTAAGVSGSLTTLETKAETVNVVSAVYHSSADEVTNDLRLEDDGFGFVVVKSLDLDSTGKLTETVATRYITKSN